MDVPTKQTTPSDDRRTHRSLYAGIAVWFLHQNVIYALPSLSCKWGWFSNSIAGTTGLVVLEALLTLLAAAVMVYLISIPWRNWRKYQTEKPPENPNLIQDTEKDRRPLEAFIALALNCFFLLFILASFIPVFALNACGQA